MVFDYEQEDAAVCAALLVKTYLKNVVKYEKLRARAPAPPAVVPFVLQEQLRATQRAMDSARSRARLYDVLRITSVAEPLPQDFKYHRKTRTLLEDVARHQAPGGNKVWVIQRNRDNQYSNNPVMFEIIVSPPGGGVQFLCHSSSGSLPGTRRSRNHRCTIPWSEEPRGNWRRVCLLCGNLVPLV